MNIEEIDKWLDNEYGVSYTRLEELHDFYFEKYCDLKEENKQLKEHIEKYEHYCKTTGIEELMKENKKYKEVIDKANNFIINHLRQDMLSDFTGANYIQEYIINPDELLDILKEVE